jgi:hypothetical protein
LSYILQDDGQLIIAVPNAEYQMQVGDPGLFLYEHLSYFTKSSLNNIFQMARLEIIEFKESIGDLYITAKKSKKALNNYNESNQDPLLQYSNQLNNRINQFKKNTKGINRLGIWGACGTAVNLFEMIKLKDYTIFDSDEYKVGKSISGLNGIVYNPTMHNIVERVDSVCVIPIGAQKVISKVLKEQYDFPYFKLF